jgi:hypothetical protein
MVTERDAGGTAFGVAQRLPERRVGTSLFSCWKRAARASNRDAEGYAGTRPAA